eukprot:TRINITY_DN249_c0_g1_i18.p1 TRINITY_DN249_c0_g1~~TRINITY_DN249_c0_g1_i18.p1  ORF type:complete len:452 (+),score=65.96 TRINITY_DN249_c0_g1_i18:77-1432(+)
MYSISIITAMVVAQDTCTGLSIADCTSSSRFGCSWLPSSGECVRLCFDLNEAECTSNPACEYYSGYCIDVAPCSERMLESCIANCGIVAGQNTCRSCSSAANKTDCGRISNCEWDGQKCGASSLECFTFSQSECTETGCSWRGHCNVPSVFYDGLCKTSNTTNCIRYKNDLVPCSELTTRPLCAWQATCEWNSFSQSCVDADFCLAIGDEGKDLCESVGCTDADDMFCTNATAFTKCASISDKDNCNNQKTCAFYEIYNTSTCSPALGCNSLPESVCTEKPDCRWNSSSNTCGDSGRPCGEIRMLCGGEKCKNMVRDPDMTEYSYFGSFFDGQLLASKSDGQPLKNGIPCIDCPVCQPGYVTNVGATIQCGADGIGSFGQQICVIPGNYSDPASTPASPDGDDNNNIIIIIIIATVGGALLLVIVLVVVVSKVCSKKRVSNNDGYSQELCQ